VSATQGWTQVNLKWAVLRYFDDIQEVECQNVETQIVDIKMTNHLLMYVPNLTKPNLTFLFIS
jgi:hypothetical protein